MQNFRKLWSLPWIVALLFTLAGLLFCCRTFSHQEPQTLRRALVSSDPNSLELKDELSDTTHAILSDLFEGLVCAEKDGSFSPGMAHRWEHEAEKEWKFFIHPRARWSNGQAVTAEDFVVTIERLFERAATNPRLKERLQTLCADELPILNAKEVLEGELSPAALGVAALNAKVLALHLKEPRRTKLVLNALSKPYFFAQAKAQSDIFKSPCSSWWVNGPFCLDRAEPSQPFKNPHLILKKNPAYLWKKRVHLQEVSWLIFDSAEACEEAWRQKRIDLFKPVAKSELLKDRFYPDLWWDGSETFWELVPNCQAPSLENQSLRECLAQFFDRSAIAEACASPAATPRYGLVSLAKRIGSSKPSWMHESQEAHFEDVREYLVKRNHSEENPLRVEIIFNETPENFLSVCQELEKSVPELSLSFVKLNEEEYLKRQLDKDFQLCLRKRGSDYFPAMRYKNFLNEDPNNIGGCDTFADVRSFEDMLIGSASTSYDAQSYKEFEMSLLRTWPALPLLSEPNYLVARSSVGGLGLASKNPSGQCLSKNLYILPLKKQLSAEARAAKMDQFCRLKSSSQIEENAYLFFW